MSTTTTNSSIHRQTPQGVASLTRYDDEQDLKDRFENEALQVPIGSDDEPHPAPTPSTRNRIESDDTPSSGDDHSGAFPAQRNIRTSQFSSEMSDEPLYLSVPRWCDLKGQLLRVQHNGGEFVQRARNAVRAATGSLIYFSSLTFSEPRHLSAIWIGNIFFHFALQKNVGTSLKMIWGLATSILLTTLGSWPIAHGLTFLTGSLQRLILPPLIFILSFLVMSCPWVVSPNVMVLLMYINVATPIRFEATSEWEPLTNMASYWIGLAMAITMNLLPPWRPNTATQQAHKHLYQLGLDLETLWNHKQQYTFTTGRSSKNARVAAANIPVLVQRIEHGVQALRGLLPAVYVELWWTGRYERATRLEDWVKVLQTSLKEFAMLQSALNSRFLGEASGSSNDPIRYVRHLIAEELGVEYQFFVQDLIDCTLECNRWADPFYETTALPEDFSNKSLVAGIQKSRLAFVGVFLRAMKENQGGPSHIGGPTPFLTHLLRQSTALFSELSIAETLENHMEAIVETQASPKQAPSLKVRMGAVFKSMGLSHWKSKWHWNDPVKRRLALKTSLGVMVASLWMASNRLWNLSQPFGFWPGLTVASVNLATTGSSFRKATDRLIGTLFAAAFALLVADFFPGNHDGVKVVSIAIFTAFVIYMKSDDRAYQYSYAATSIGSMLYGSVKVDYDVVGYIPQRIQLIFIGVITFALVELLLFPKSSRVTVESSTLEFVDTLLAFLNEARGFAVQVQNDPHPGDTTSDEEDDQELLVITTQLANLKRLSEKLTSISRTLKEELKSGLMEPYFAFSYKLSSQAMSNIVSEIGLVEMKSLLLVNALNLVARLKNGYNGSSTEKIGWHNAYAEFLRRVCSKMEETSQTLKEAFPDGRFRPQCSNTNRAIAAAASFRDFRDVRLAIVSTWSDLVQQADDAVLANPNDLIVSGITTAFIMELCRHLEMVGKGMEQAAGYFPPCYES